MHKRSEAQDFVIKIQSFFTDVVYSEILKTLNVKRSKIQTIRSRLQEEENHEVLTWLRLALPGINRLTMMGGG